MAGESPPNGSFPEGPFASGPGLDLASPLRSTELEGRGGVSIGSLETTLEAVESHLAALSVEDEVQRVRLGLKAAGLMADVGRSAEARMRARALVPECVSRALWQEAAEACRVVYLCDGDDALCALGQGVWLAVTIPVDPELTVAMLQHIVEETPDDSDGAAVAAATAQFIADVRSGSESLALFSGRILSEVARRHSAVESRADFDAWVVRLELDDPDRFLVRLRNVIDVLVQDQWWFDVEAVRAGIAAT